MLKDRPINLLFYIIIILILGQYTIKDFDTIKYNRPFFILRNISLSYDKKMEMKVGKTPYDYAMFVKDNTSSDSTILIPPQGYPWDKTGNVAYFRYFLYPRKLINGNEKDPNIDIKDVDYVLIDYGETTISEHGFTNIWPKFNITGVYIAYWEPNTGNVLRDNTGVYKYKPGDTTEKWGIIKIRK
jgi:hypothetical protein